jgi:hypothetical protein
VREDIEQPILLRERMMMMTTERTARPAHWRRHLIVGASAACFIAGGAAIASAGGENHPPLGRAAPVVADPAPQPATTAAAPATAPKRSADAARAAEAAARVSDDVALLRRPAVQADAVPDDVAAPVKSLPGIDLSSARRVPVVDGAAPFWILTVSTGQVLLAGAQHTGGYGPGALRAGELMRVDESIQDDPQGVAVSGVLPDDAHDVYIGAHDGAHAIELQNNTYSVRFGVDAASQPRTLSWQDRDGAHTLAVPLSPDIVQP